jgi:formylglycine-generating enzyme required for sulfatase activity
MSINIKEILRSPRVVKVLRIEAVILIGLGVFLNLTAPKKSDASAGLLQDKGAGNMDADALKPVVKVEKPKEVVIRSRDGSGILHHYAESVALVVGQSGNEKEINSISTLLSDRAFVVKKSISPSSATLRTEIKSLNQSPLAHSESRRILVYMTGETIDPDGRNEVFFRTSDTPAGSPTAQQLRQSAYAMDDLRYLVNDLDGNAITVVVNSGMRTLILEESGAESVFLTRESFQKPTPFFIVSNSEGGQPDPQFSSRFIRAFAGGADSDCDRQVSVVELARYIGSPAYLASMTGGSRKGPGLVFDLPADAAVKALTAEQIAALEATQHRVAEIVAPDATQSMESERPLRIPKPGELPEEGTTFDSILGQQMFWQSSGKFNVRYAASGGAAATDAAPVTVEGFWMSRSEITDAQYSQQMKSEPTGDGSAAKVNVSWQEAVAFCDSLTESEIEAGRLPEGYTFRLPYEVEWEYASKSGATRFRKTNIVPLESWTKRLSGIAVSGDDYANTSSDFLAMSSGVKEWCLDAYVKSTAESRSPTPPTAARVVRGGIVDDQMTRLSTRFGIYAEGDRLPHIGFRIVLGRDSGPPMVAGISQTPIEPDKVYSREELFEGSKYTDWDSYNQGLILTKAQEKFKEQELYTIGVDGSAGPSTQNALNQFQANQRLIGSGRLDDATLAALGLDIEEKKIAPKPTPKPKPVYKPWWVTRPSSPRAGDKEPPESIYSGFRGKGRLIGDKAQKKLNASEYRKYETYERWQKVN